MEYKPIKLPQEVQDLMDKVKESKARAMGYWLDNIKVDKPKKLIEGIRLQVPIAKAPWRMVLPINTDISNLKMPELQEFLTDQDINLECILYPEYTHKGIQYTLHTCDYHEYVIIEWTTPDYLGKDRWIK